MADQRLGEGSYREDATARAKSEEAEAQRVEAMSVNEYRKRYPPTDRQLEIVKWMLDFQRRNGVPPTIRELGKGVEIGSTNGAAEVLRVLIKKGFVAKSPLTAENRLMTRQYFAIQEEFDKWKAENE